MSLQKVCFVGANGTLGSVILEGFLSANSFNISVLKRESSKSSLPSSVNEITIPDDFPLEALETALRGQDAVIAVFPLKDVSQHLRLVEAAFRAGVKRFIPADFGSCDAADEEPKKLLKLYRDKNMVREKCEKLAAGNEEFTWTALVPGHFFDYGLRDGLLHFNLETKKAQILDGGSIPASASTLRRIAEGTVAILRNPSTTKNRTVYIQSFCHTQNEILAVLEKVTGSKWETEDLESKSFIEKEVKKMEEGDGDALEEIVFALGQLGADWRKRDGFAMKELGLEDENLEDVIKEVIKGQSKA